ncbi:hypothetical protein IF2G_05667 [Cordyceps javanica]|nr:hypothetical protein IF2G_05667 [Cordyceps javanica]
MSLASCDTLSLRFRPRCRAFPCYSAALSTLRAWPFVPSYLPHHTRNEQIKEIASRREKTCTAPILFPIRTAGGTVASIDFSFLHFDTNIRCRRPLALCATHHLPAPEEKPKLTTAKQDG